MIHMIILILSDNNKRLRDSYAYFILGQFVGASFVNGGSMKDEDVTKI